MIKDDRSFPLSQKTNGHLVKTLFISEIHSGHVSVHLQMEILCLYGLRYQIDQVESFLCLLCGKT